MFNLSLKEEWTNNKKFCHRLSDEEDEEHKRTAAIQEAKDRLAANKSRQSSPTSSTAAMENNNKEGSDALPGPGPSNGSPCNGTKKPEQQRTQHQSIPAQ